MWFTKMTSSLSSRESGEELESVSMPSESLLLSSLMLITPPLSTVCLGTLCWRPLGFPDWKQQHTRQLRVRNKTYSSESLHERSRKRCRLQENERVNRGCQMVREQPDRIKKTTHRLSTVKSDCRANAWNVS